MAKPINILIADDHELLRDGIKTRLEKQPGWRICGETDNGRDAVRLATESQPDVVVMDIGMPQLNGIEAATQIRQVSPQTGVLILTMQESEDLVRSALVAGVRGFVLKTDAGRLLVTAVETVLSGNPFFTGRVSEIVLADFLNPDRAAQAATDDRQRLTPREREVLQLLAEAKTSKEAALTLGVSLKTVEAHRANIMRKLNVHSIAELVRYAVRNKIIEA
jgi:DNA-binding NarL/FixJ family response regulator